MSIKVLSTHLVNKIAAGEVIERPASVVKELVENALDAGATRIDVDIEDGGKRLIRVADNGSGMDLEDLKLAFIPHATSKITGEDDLFAIQTMGFRGEALASVASVAHASIRTCRRADDQADETPTGWEIEASGESIGQPRPTSAPPGTTVTIRDLFFNTPARRKFMRTANTEIGHIGEQITRVALPHPGVAFQLTHNGRQTMNLPATDSTRRRAADVLGSELGDVLIPLAPRTGPVQVQGLIAPPSAARSSAKWQYFFLNGRYVRDRLMSHALREAYRGLLDGQRWPVAMIFIEVDPGDVDVNVHPTKVEVRFRDGQAVHGALMASLKETLNRAQLAPRASLDRARSDADDEGPANRTGEHRESLKQALADFFRNAPRPSPPESPEGRTVSREEFGRYHRDNPTAREPSSTSQQPPSPHRAQPTTPGSDPWPGGFPSLEHPPQEHRETREQPREVAATQAPEPHSGKVPARMTPAAPRGLNVMQIHDSYLVLQTPDGVSIIDQHALHERILYNQFRRRLAEGRLSSQRLLIPQPLQVTQAEADLLDRSSELLSSLGIEVQPFGPGTVAMQQFPTLLAERGVQADDFLRELLDSLSEDETFDPERALQGILSVLACKAAVKAGDPLTPDEIEGLLAQVEDLDKASSCPHGRPTTLTLTLGDLEKQFRRT